MKFKIILCDIPWSYSNWKSKDNGAAASHYRTSSVDDIASWPVQDIADTDSLLFMWATGPKLPEALRVMSAWGFTYVSLVFVWNKLYASEKPYCGLGFWSRSGSELVLLGRRGRGVPRAKEATGVRQVVCSAVVGKHSSKPPEIRERIEQLTGDCKPRIELFARGPVPGWTATGLESDGRLLTDAVDYYKELLL
jgi:N6-adenosine-specific RNA methylase IME4